MTAFVYYAGTDISSKIRLEDGVAGLTQAADGSFVTGGVKLDDASGSDTYVEWQPFIYDETACSVPRTFTGYLTTLRNRRDRDSHRLGASRIHDFDVTDLNILLTVQPLRGSTAKRPVETGNARMAWLLASVALHGIVFDDGLVGDIPDDYDEADYTGMRATDVLSDLCVSSSDEVGRIFFVRWDHTAGHPSLFIDLPSAAVHTSTLSISNVLSDVNETTVFWPYLDPELEQDGAEIYCSVFFKYKTGQVYLHNDTTHATYFTNGFHRQAVFETTRVGSATTAQRHAQQYLAAHSGANQVYSLRLQLPKDKVNLIEAGHRVQTKLSHIPGLSSFTYLRVSERTVSLTPGTPEFYDVDLKLTNKGITPSGGGGTGVFPHPPPSVGGIVQQVSGRGTLVMPNPIADGDTLVFVEHSRGGTVWNYAAAGYTLSPLGETQDPSFGTHRTLVAYKTASGESQTLSISSSDVGGTWYELAGSWAPDTSDENHDVAGNGVTFTAGPITVAANNITFATSSSGTTGGWDAIAGTITHTPSAGWVEDFDSPMASGGPSSWNGHYTAPAGSLTAQTVSSFAMSPTDRPAWTMQIVSFVSSDLGATEPPSPAQWVYGETPTPAPDGSTTTFSTLFPFADGSLTVYVDNLDQTAAVTSYDGAAGTFTLAFAPWGTDVLRVDYQGR